MSALKNLIGQRFGRLTVIARAENKGKHATWLCKCDCGNICTVWSTSLISGNTRSCGCLNNEKRISRATKHNMVKSPIFKVWSVMKERCFNPHNKSYPRYGGRGITVYPAWLDDFKAFYDYVSQLENYGVEGYTLDRIDNNGNYEPNNLRWVDRKTQARNRRTNHLVEYQNKTMTLIEASELSGINYKTLTTRLLAGDTGERLFRPVKQSSCHKS